MASLSIPNSFTNNTVASATEVNANFTSVKSFAESALVQVDGSVQAPTAAIANLAVTTAKIADGTVTLEKLATALVNYLIPVGSVQPYAGSIAPTGWLICDGQSTTGYTNLAAVVGANVPDLRGRTIVGAGTGTGLTARSLNATGGAETHLLTSSESGVGPHNHTTSVSVLPHKHLLSSLTSTGLGGYGAGDLRVTTSQATYGYAYTDPVTDTVFVNINTNSANASSAHNNMQPFYALNYIIKH